MTADMQIPTDLTPEQLAAVAHLLPTGPCTIRPERGRSHYGTVEITSIHAATRVMPTVTELALASAVPLEKAIEAFQKLKAGAYTLPVEIEDEPDPHN